MASTIPGWDDMLTNLSSTGTSSLSGGDYTQNLSPEDLASLNTFFSKPENAHARSVMTQRGGEGPDTYNNEFSSLNLGGRQFGSLGTPVTDPMTGAPVSGAGQYSTLLPGQDNLYANYDSTGKYSGTSSVSNNFMDKFGRALPYITGAALGGIAAFGGAAAGAGAGAAAGGGTTAGVVAGGGGEAGGLLSKAALDGTAAFGANSVPGALSAGSYAGTAIPAAVDLGTAGGITTTGAGTAGGGLPSLFGNNLTARTAIQGASSLYDMYAKNKMAKAQQDLLSKNQQQINNLYAPGSPEYNLLAEKIARSNAAAGRNSQVGQFASTLAGTIADAKLRASSGALPAQSSLLNSSLGNQYGGLSSLFFNLMNQGKQ